MKRSKICKAISIGLMLALLLTQLTFVTAFAAETTYTAEQIITGTNAELEDITLSTSTITKIYDIDVSKGYFYKFDVKFNADSNARAMFFSDDDGDTRLRFDLNSDKLVYPTASKADGGSNSNYTHAKNITYHYIIAVAPNDTVTYYRAEDDGAYQKLAITDSALFKTLANDVRNGDAGNRGFDITPKNLTSVDSAVISVYYTKYEKDSILAGFEQTNVTNTDATAVSSAKVSTLFDESKKWAAAIDVKFANTTDSNFVTFVTANDYRIRFQADAKNSKLYLGGANISSNIGTSATAKQKDMDQVSIAYTIAEGTTHNFIVVMTNSGWCDLYAKASTDTTYQRLMRRFAQDWKTADALKAQDPWAREVRHSGVTNVTIEKVEVYSADVDNDLLGDYNKVAENATKADFNYTANATDDMAYQFDVKLGDADDTFSAYMYLPDGEYRTRLYIAKDFIDYMYHTPAEGETDEKWVSRIAVDNTPGVEYSYVVKIIDDAPYYYRKVKNSDSGYVLVAQGNALEEIGRENPEIDLTVTETVTCTASVYTTVLHPTEAQLIGNMEQIVTVPFEGTNTIVTGYPIKRDEARVIKFDYKLTAEDANVTAFIDDGAKRCRIQVTPGVLKYVLKDHQDYTTVDCVLESELNKNYTILVCVNGDYSATWYRKSEDEATYTAVAKSEDLFSRGDHQIKCAALTDATAAVSIYQNKANLSFRDSNGAVTDTLANVNKVHLSLLTNDLEENESNTYMMIVGVYNGEVLAGAKLVPITVTENGVVTQDIAITDVVDDASGITDIKGFIWTDAYAPVADALEM